MKRNLFFTIKLKEQNMVEYQIKKLFFLKKNFFKNLGFIFFGRKKVLIVFKGNIFPMKVMDNNASEKNIIKPFKNTNKKINTRNRNQNNNS